MKSRFKSKLLLVCVLALVLGLPPLDGTRQPPVSAAPEIASPFGMNSGLTLRFREKDSDRERAADLLAQAGTAWLREEFCWGCIEPEPHLTPRAYRWQVDGFFDYDRAVVTGITLWKSWPLSTG